MNEKATSLVRSLTQSPSLPENRLKEIESSLVSIGGPAVPNLIGLLNRRKFPSCVRAAEILGRIGDPEAVPALTTALLHEDLGETAGKVLQQFGPTAVPRIIDLVHAAVTPGPNQKAPPKKYLFHALITLGAIRCNESALFLNSLLDDYITALPPGPFNTEKHQWPFRNIDFFLLLDSMVKQQDERAVPHIRRAMLAFDPQYTDHLVCRIAIGRIIKKMPDGFLPQEALDISFPASAMMSAFTGEDYDHEKEIEDTYGDLLRAVDGEEPEPLLIEDIINQYTSTFTIEYVYGNDTIEETLTVPRRRPFKNVFQFKIALHGTRPALWRRLLIPESFTFYDFHVAIQDAMNWLDYHLHHFEIPGAGSSPDSALHIECPWYEPFDRDDDWLLTTEVKLKDHFQRRKDRALYRYDYGDGWEIDILLEDILPKQKSVRYPSCLDGALAGPPEDCGGISGYRECIFNPRLIAFENPRSRFKKALS
ncbi:MAG: hypothetical protein KJ727_06150 [Acidobacteria bacterium]|nr:hypothetical protein [Acidobacteriota bacterium]